MEQMITKEEIAEAAEKYAEQKNSAWTNDYNGFEAGANFVMQLLQQTPCTTPVCDKCDADGWIHENKGDIIEHRLCDCGKQMA